MPIFIQLCNDQVSEVRNEAAKAAGSFAKKFKEEGPEFLSDFLFGLRLYGSSNKYFSRQVFCWACVSIMEVPDTFNELFLQEFVKLSKDKVVNVRMTLSDALASYFA